MIARCTVVWSTPSATVNAADPLAGELKDDGRHMEPYGYTSCPQTRRRRRCLVAGGDRSHGVVIVIVDRRFRLQGLAVGEVALYTDEGDKIHRARKPDLKTGTLNVEASEEVHFLFCLQAQQRECAARSPMVVEPGAGNLPPHQETNHVLQLLLRLMCAVLCSARSLSACLPGAGLSPATLWTMQTAKAR